MGNAKVENYFRVTIDDFRFYFGDGEDTTTGVETIESIIFYS